MGPLITICARGGSQGVKNKNIRPLLGKPLIAHTVECAARWGKADRIVVSTDSDQIAKVAQAHGAEVPFLRPSELGRGEVPKMAVIRHALDQVERAAGTRYEAVIDLDVTAPLRHPADIEAAFNLFQAERPLTVFSVVRARKNPYYNMVETDAQGFAHLSKNWDEAITCRQIAPAVYEMNASIHIYSRDYLVDERNWHVCSERSLPYVMEEASGVDIDSDTDFLYIEFLVERGAFVL